jgi:hypothetical protein
MQTLRILSLIAIMLVCAFYAQSQNYKAQNISATGEIKDSTGKVIGKIHNGTVFDAKATKLGYIDANGIVTDANGKKLGRAAKNGNFYDLKDVIVLTTNDMGEVKDYKGHYIGKVDLSHRQHACVFHCFFCGGCK